MDTIRIDQKSPEIQQRPQNYYKSCPGINRTGSVDDLSRRPKHRSTISQQDRYMQINSPS
jgi:hypothetical protein